MLVCVCVETIYLLSIFRNNIQIDSHRNVAVNRDRVIFCRNKLLKYHQQLFIPCIRMVKTWGLDC